MKKLVGFVFGAAMMLAFAAPALAATNNVLFDPNGAGSTQVSKSSSVTMHAWIDTAATQDVESLFVSFPGAGGLAQQGVCYTVNPSKIGASPAGGWDISLPVQVPAAAGVWPVAVTAYGINGDAADTTCSGSVVFATQQFPSRITVTDVSSAGTPTANSGGSTTTGAGSVLSDSSKLDQLIALLTAWIAAQGHSTGSTGPAAICSQMSAYNWLHFGSTGAAGLQTFLIGNGEGMILTYGATGYYGNQTAQAVGDFNNRNRCI